MMTSEAYRDAYRSAAKTQHPRSIYTRWNCVAVSGRLEQDLFCVLVYIMAMGYLF